MRTGAVFTMLAALAAIPASAQVPLGLRKVPTPPPMASAENSLIGPDYANAPESVANPVVPQGDIREFILYSDESKIYPGIVRIAQMTRDHYQPRDWGMRLSLINQWGPAPPLRFVLTGYPIGPPTAPGVPARAPVPVRSAPR